ncbi:hypothetical protein B0T13DRAFT_229142 [Neurospora crassa]|nr:hypothetical protein B0T13DRAFT_229142 [Neurospora crassa]
MLGYVYTDRVFLRPCNFPQTANMTLRVSPNELLLGCFSGDNGSRCQLFGEDYHTLDQGVGKFPCDCSRSGSNWEPRGGRSHTGLWKYGLNKVVCCPLHQRTTARVYGRLDVLEGRPETGTYKGRNHHRLGPHGRMRRDGRGGRPAGQSKVCLPDWANEGCRAVVSWKKRTAANMSIGGSENFGARRGLGENDSTILRHEHRSESSTASTRTLQENIQFRDDHRAMTDTQSLNKPHSQHPRRQSNQHTCFVVRGSS